MGRFLSLIIVAMAVVGQTTPEPPLKPQEPFKVTAQHTIGWLEYVQPPTDPMTTKPCSSTGSIQPPAVQCFSDTSDYRLRINGAVVQTQPLSTNTDSTITFTVVGGLPAGTYDVVVEAVGNGGAGVAPAIKLPIVSTQIATPKPQGPPTVGQRPALPIGLIHAYDFNQGSGTTLTDVTGFGPNGEIVDATWVEGKFGQALSFNGTSAGVTLGDVDLPNTFTVMAWFQTRVLTWPENMCRTVINKPYTYGIALCKAEGLRAFVGDGSAIAANVQKPLTSADVNVWRHAAMTYNGTTLSFYLEGALIGTDNGKHVSSNQTLRIGRFSTAGYWNGLLDEVRIYNRALTAAEVVADMNRPVP